MANAEKYVLREYMLDLDPFKKPKIIGNKEALATLLVRLILLEPGTNPLFPEMGVGLVSKYRFLQPGDDSDLKEDIRQQVTTYLPDAVMQDITFTYNDDKTVNIEMIVNDMTFIYDSSLLVPITLKDIQDS